jgi:inosine-uridine nucleoside N-ribohydrolase
MGRTDIPIGTGVKTSGRELNQAGYLEGFDYSKYTGTVYDDGVGKMIELIEASGETITLCVIGPQTNIKAALERAPEIAEKAKVVSMAGSVYMGYDGKPEPSPEWNVFRDVEAARAVFAAPWEITMAPLDICGTLRLAGGDYHRVANAAHPFAKTVIANYTIWKNRGHHPEDSSSILFDTAAAYLCVDESLCEIETINLSIDDKGNTAPDSEGRPVRCALRWKDEAAFRELLIGSLTPE